MPHFSLTNVKSSSYQAASSGFDLSRPKVKQIHLIKCLIEELGLVEHWNSRRGEKGRLRDFT
jgi:hypothetical protein